MAAVTDVRIQQPSVFHAVWVSGRELSWRLIDDHIFSFSLQRERGVVIHEVCGPEAHEDRVGSRTHTSAFFLQNGIQHTHISISPAEWDPAHTHQHLSLTYMQTYS